MPDIFIIIAMLILLFSLVLIIKLVFKKAVGIVTIYEYERGIRYSKGRFHGLLNPGQYWFLPLVTTVDKVDLRPGYITINNQEILTLDGISVKISLAVNYEIIDPIAAKNSSENYMDSLYILLQLAIREIFSTINLDQVLEKRNVLNKELIKHAADNIGNLGIKLHSASIKDITFNSEIKKAYSKVIQAQKEGLASLEKARSESATLRSLANTAKILENNPGLMQLRIFQTLGESSGNTVVLNISDGNLAVKTTK